MHASEHVLDAFTQQLTTSAKYPSSAPENLRLQQQKSNNAQSGLISEPLTTEIEDITADVQGLREHKIHIVFSLTTSPLLKKVFVMI